jgi:hypothetical protein
MGVKLGFLTLRGEHTRTLREFEYRALRRVCRPRRNEIIRMEKTA